MREITSITSPKLEAFNPPTANYAGLSQAVAAGADRLLFLTGHVSVDESGEIIDGDFEAQLDTTFRNIRRTLVAAGADFTAAVKFTYYVVGYDPAMLAILKKVRNRYINQDCPPASTFVAVAQLYDPRLVVEIDGIIALSDRQAPEVSQ